MKNLARQRGKGVAKPIRGPIQMKRSAYPALLGMLFSGATLVMGQTQDAEITGDQPEYVFLPTVLLP